MIHLPNEIIYTISTFLQPESINIMVCTCKDNIYLKDLIMIKKIQCFRLKKCFNMFKLNIYDLKIRNISANFVQNLINNVLFNLQSG